MLRLPQWWFALLGLMLAEGASRAQEMSSLYHETVASQYVQNVQTGDYPGDPNASRLFNISRQYPYTLADTSLVFESNLTVPFLVWGSTSLTKLATHAIVICPEIRIRMLHIYSVPVLPPSYLVHLKYYFLLRERAYGKETFAMIFSVNHHSNGNPASPIYRNGLNLSRGSFSTNYFLLQTYRLYHHPKSKTQMTHTVGSGMEYHLPDTFLNRAMFGIHHTLGEYYGRHRISFYYGCQWLLSANEKQPVHRLTFQLSFTYILDVSEGTFLQEFFASYDVPQHIAVAEFVYKPPWKSNLSFFVRYFDGQDYYNIYFFRRLQQTQYGFYMKAAGLNY